MSESVQRPPWVPEGGGAEFATTVMPGVVPAGRSARPAAARKAPGADELVEGIFAGERSLVSRAITLV